MRSLTSLVTKTSIAVLLLAACHKEDVEPAPFDAIVFGSFYNECGGEGCVEIYKLDLAQQTLAEDTTDAYPNSSTFYDGRYVLRNQADFQRTQQLQQLVPSQLLNNTTTVIGAPDTSDQGGYYLEVTRNGQRQFWLIDTNKSAIPPYLHAFIDSLQARIQALR